MTPKDKDIQTHMYIWKNFKKKPYGIVECLSLVFFVCL